MKSQICLLMYFFYCIFNVTNHNVNRLILIELAFRIPQQSSLDVLPVSISIYARSSIVFQTDKLSISIKGN